MLVTTQFEPVFDPGPDPDDGTPTGEWENFDNVRDDKALAFIIWNGLGTTFTIKVQGQVAEASGAGTIQYAIKKGNFQQDNGAGDYFPTTATNYSADEGPYAFFARPMQDANGAAISGFSSMHYYFPKNPRCRLNVTANNGNDAGLWGYFIH